MIYGSVADPAIGGRGGRPPSGRRGRCSPLKQNMGSQAVPARRARLTLFDSKIAKSLFTVS